MSDAWRARRGAEPALSWMVAFSAFLHVAAGIAIALLPRQWLMRTPPPVVAYTVKIVDPSALGGRLPQGPIRTEPAASVANPAPREVPETKPEVKPKPEPKKPEPKPEPKAEPPKPEEKKVVTLPDVEKKTEPKPEAKKPQPTPRPSKAELAKIERDKQIQEAIKHLGEKGNSKKAAGLGGTEAGKGAALGTGGNGGGGGILMGLDFIIYKNQVEGLIKKNWTWVGANPDLTIRVGFRIGDNGEIGDVRVIDRSGDASFDDSVLRAIRISTPLPAPPAKYRDVFANYVLEFVSGQLAAGG
jgi:colicin import membrane protein